MQGPKQFNEFEKGKTLSWKLVLETQQSKL